ncbi:MAG: hypothetical protein GY834_07020 [Bacteroidetes bacterium]|nr:hypothetical protein [Bacteroidota bacterium]
MNSLKRNIPNIEIINWRKQYLRRLKSIKPLNQSGIKPMGLSKGNSKLGQFGKYYNSIFVWNLPSVSACPAASNWCMKNCYNADPRIDKFPVSEWQANWWWSIHNRAELKIIINEQLKSAEKPCAVRLHSSGDFFSIEYINFWHDIVNMNPDISFWAYTRSWNIENLLFPLSQLRNLNNFQLFASWDESMNSNPPPDWRISLVIDDLSKGKELDRNKDYSCPEQFGKKLNCASCGFCIKASDKNIIFTLH